MLTFKKMVFPIARNASEAKLQANVVDRSVSLLSDGYTVKTAEEVTNIPAPLLWMVTSPEGKTYVVDGYKGKCGCECHAQHGFCKHYGHIDREQEQIARLEAECEFAY